ncbi:MAG TPA: four helix bundle protein [Chloroflexota bacterium]|nr:four helix bundle protein [Chloroflexota bacterium]
MVEPVTGRDFTDLKAWKQARKLRALTFEITKRSTFDVEYGLRNQMRSAAPSVMSIAEGFEREGNRQFLQFLWIAKGSAGELRSQSYAARDSDLLRPADFEALHATAVSTSQLIAGLIRCLKRTDLRGSRNRAPDDPLGGPLHESPTDYATSTLPSHEPIFWGDVSDLAPGLQGILQLRS